MWRSSRRNLKICALGMAVREVVGAVIVEGWSRMMYLIIKIGSGAKTRDFGVFPAKMLEFLAATVTAGDHCSYSPGEGLIVNNDAVPTWKPRQ